MLEIIPHSLQLNTIKINFLLMQNLLCAQVTLHGHYPCVDSVIEGMILEPVTLKHMASSVKRQEGEPVF